MKAHALNQASEALAKAKYSHVFDAYSAGTETKPRNTQNAVRILKELYNIHIEATQKSKLLDELPPIKSVVTMGCNVNCPYLPCKSREDWGLDDSISQDDAVFKKTIGIIEEKLENLAERIRQGLGS